jgi:hypothetical protein
VETSLETEDIMVKLGWTEIHQNGTRVNNLLTFRGDIKSKINLVQFTPCRVILLLLNMKLEREGKCKR